VTNYPEHITTEKDLRTRVEAWKAAGERIAFVPTMGSLHAGHEALWLRASEMADRVVLSIFVNPLQFGVGEDFERYPRDVASDIARVGSGPVDVIFTPGVTDVYPRGLEATPTMFAGVIGDVFEGVSRPGHFDGVLTVVHRLCEMVTPDVVVFGHKDAQQLFLITNMVATHSLPFAVEAVETVRDPDGLALSSRNNFLTPHERTGALALTQALDLASRQESVVAAVAAARGVLAAEPLCEVDYVAVIDPDTFKEIEAAPRGGVCQMLIAATIGTTRLIDNKRFSIPQ